MSKKITELVVSSLEDIKAKLEFIDKKLDSILELFMSTSTNKACNTFKNLPWKNFKNDDEATWIYANQKGAEQLVERLKKAKGNVIFCEKYRYSLSQDGNSLEDIL